jgi:hypothetical protein
MAMVLETWREVTYFFVFLSLAIHRHQYKDEQLYQ